jgi:hypothetical protein
MNREPSPQLELPIGEPPDARKPRREANYRGYLLNAARVRQYALDVAKRQRHHAFTAVTVDFIQRIDARLRNIIQDEVKRHPSKGKRLA